MNKLTIIKTLLTLFLLINNNQAYSIHGIYVPMDGEGYQHNSKEEDDCCDTVLCCLFCTPCILTILGYEGIQRKREDNKVLNAIEEDNLDNVKELLNKPDHKSHRNRWVTTIVEGRKQSALEALLAGCPSLSKEALDTSGHTIGHKVVLAQWNDGCSHLFTTPNSTLCRTKNSQGETPLAVAQRMNYTFAVQLLEDK